MQIITTYYKITVQQDPNFMIAAPNSNPGSILIATNVLNDFALWQVINGIGGFQLINKGSGLSAWANYKKSLFGKNLSSIQSVYQDNPGNQGYIRFTGMGYRILEQYWTWGASDNGFAAIRPASGSNFNMNVSGAGDSSSIQQGMNIILYSWSGTKNNMLFQQVSVHNNCNEASIFLYLLLLHI